MLYCVMYGYWSSEHIGDGYFPEKVRSRPELTSSSGASDQKGNKKAGKFNTDFVSDDSHGIFDDVTGIIDLCHAAFLYDDAMHSAI